MKECRLWSIVFLPFLVVASSLSAQTPTIPRAGETIEVSIVNVEAVVTDRKGNRVQGLGAADFEIRENGKPQPISNFSEYAEEREVVLRTPGAPAGPAPAAAARMVEPRRTIVLFVERTQLLPWEADELFGSLSRFAHEVVRPGDAMAIFSWFGSMKLRQDYTDDLVAIDKVIAEIREENKRLALHEFNDDWEKRMEMQDAITASTPDGVAPLDIMSMDNRMMARRALISIRAKTHALNSVMSSMAGSRGRKILIMAMRRFSRYAGAEYYGGQMGPSEQQEFDTAKYRKSLIEQANAAGVTIYPVYHPGLPSGGGPALGPGYSGSRASMSAERTMQRAIAPSMILTNETTSLTEVARGTGGLSTWGAKAAAELIPEIADDLRSYYSIGYRTPPLENGGSRHISVTTTDRALKVRVRRDYVEKSDQDRMSDLVLANLYRAADGATIRLVATLGEIRREKKRVVIPVKVSVPIGSLTALPDPKGRAGAFSVFAAAGGPVGVASDVMQKTQPFTIPAADYEKARESTYGYSFEVVTDGRANRLSIGVLDEISEEYGMVRIDLPTIADKSN